MKKPLMTSAVCGIILLVFIFVFGIIRFLPLEKVLINYFSVIFLICISLLSIFFYFGFIVLARKYNTRLLLVMTWIGIAGSIIFFVLMFIYLIMSFFILPVNALTGAGQSNLARTIFMVLIILWIIFTIILGLFTILFGIGLLKLKDKVQLSKVAAILNIISGATMIIVIGFIISLVAIVLEIIMFYKASIRLECNRSIEDYKKKVSKKDSVIKKEARNQINNF
jgi:hypothetical protein